MKYAPVSLSFLAALALGACTGNLSSRTARQQIAELGDASLVTDDIQIQRIVTELGDRAIAEANVRMAFQFEKGPDDEWVIVSARLGDRQWVDIEELLGAIEAQNAEETHASLEKLAAGLRTYRIRNGSLPVVGDDAYLSDVLHPLFMTDLVRDDAWGGRIVYTAEGDAYELRAPGPDGRTGTADDVVFDPASP